MDVVIASGGDLKSEDKAQITERNVTDLGVRESFVIVNETNRLSVI